MANPLVQSIIRLATRLGANPSKFTGSRTNIRFLGSGPSNELFSQSLRINELPGLFQAGGKLKPSMLSKVESGAGYAMAGKLSTPQLRTLEASLKAMDNLQSSFMKPTGIINTESFRALGRRRARGSEFKELGQRLTAQRTQGFKEAMEAAEKLLDDETIRDTMNGDGDPKHTVLADLDQHAKNVLLPDDHPDKPIPADPEYMWRTGKELDNETITINGQKYKPIKEEKKKYNPRVLKEIYDRTFRSLK